jgi:hypothetical protein
MMEADESKGSSRATCSSRLSRAWALLRNSVLAAVNPRFSTFTYAFTLAIIVGLMTFGAVVGITISLMSQCSKSCGLRPVVWLEQEEAPKWYTPLQKAISVSYGAKEPLKGLTCVNDQGSSLFLDLKTTNMPLEAPAVPIVAPPSNPPGGPRRDFVSVYAPVWNSTKCSVLHTADCGRKEWAALYQGLLAIANVSRGLPAVWPTTAAYSQYRADEVLEAVVKMDRSSPLTSVDSKKLLTGTKAPTRLPAMPDCSGYPGNAIPATCNMALSEGAAAGHMIYQVGLIRHSC